MDAALKIYEQLYHGDSTNMIFFDALRRAYMQAKRYPDVVAMTQDWLKTQPNDLALIAELGRVYSYMSDDGKANAAWDRAIAISPQNENTYRVVASIMLEGRLFDKAVQVYLRGRKALGKPMLFAADLAYLYTTVLNYPEATREYLNLLKSDKTQFMFVEGHVAIYTVRPEGLAAAVSVVEQASKSDPDNAMLLDLLSWLYMEGRNYDKAYAIERAVDEKTNMKGNRIYVFAERALREHAVSAAANAFQTVISKYPSFPLMPQAKYGYARTLEDSSAKQDTFHLFRGGAVLPGTPASESEPAFKGAIAAYRSIVNEYPNTEIAARALLQIARLMYDRFFNLDEARSALETLRKQYASFASTATEGEFLLGDVSLAGGDLSKSEASYSAVVKSHVGGRDMDDRATFRLAQLAYFRGHFSDATRALGELSKNPGSNITNDALDLLLFIQENLKADSVALTQYAQAELLHQQHKLSESLAAAEEIRKKYASTPLIDETLMNIGDLFTEMGRYPEAVAAYDSLAADFPESIVLDRALLKIARIHERGLHDTAKAIEAYQQLLVKYPTSIYCSEARKQIRVLRGDTL